MLPDPFVGIELRSVAGQLFELQPRSCPAGKEIFDRPSSMNRRTIPDHQQLAWNLVHEVLQEAYRVLSLEGSLLKGHVELALERDGAHRREVISCELLLENGRLSHRGVSANHHRQQVEA